MKKILILCLGVLGLISHSFAETKCFLLKEGEKILIREGEDCDQRYAPCSTFKIPLSLMGYEEKILTTESLPQWPFQEGYTDAMEKWKQPHTPQMWMPNSCVWFSQVLTEKMGMEKLQKYVNEFEYGNKDLSGDTGKDNGLTQSWLSSSLEISPEEQTIFLQKILDRRWAISDHAYEMTKKILFVSDLPNGWKLYGKTGNGRQLSTDRSTKLDLQQGWFVGWIEKEDRKIVFVSHLTDDKKQDTPASIRMREETKKRLEEFVK